MKLDKQTLVIANLTSLKQAAKKLDDEPRIGENPNEDQLDGAIAALDKSVPAKDQLATIRSANQVTLLAAKWTILKRSLHINSNANATG